MPAKRMRCARARRARAIQRLRRRWVSSAWPCAAASRGRFQKPWVAVAWEACMD
jgi:hypothetical protein